jgi:TPR repeat protein
LGIAYYEGSMVQKNDKLALSWLRESIRNGYYPSYLLAGDILFEGNIFNLPKERCI